MNSNRSKASEALGRVLNAPPFTSVIRFSFRLLSHVLGVNNVDYFYDRRDGVWIVRSGDLYLGVGTRVSRLWPRLAKRHVEIKLRNTTEWYADPIQIRDAAVIVDIGAGDGIDTVVFAKLAGAKGRVVAVEAHPKTARLLRATCRYNNLPNVVVVNCAITDRVGHTGMSDLANHTANRVESAPGRKGSCVVDTLTVDALCDRYNISRIDFLKMNIEGAELQALRGMEASVRQMRSACICCHDFAIPGSDGAIQKAVTAFMKLHGFESSSKSEDDRPWVREHLFFERVVAPKSTCSHCGQ